MGAVAGWVAGAGGAPAAAIAPMLEALAHRGERAAALDAGRVLLGARGPQFLHDEASGIALALDGELCNRAALRAYLAARGHRFEGDSSAEVLLRAYRHWDKDVARELRGAFAFALWDARKDRLMLARDRFGEKPLYLAESGGALYFASETKALLAHPAIRAELDLASVWDFLALGYVPGPRTLVWGVRKLAPGCYALWQFGQLREVRYWTPPDREALVRREVGADPVGEFIGRLDEAVKERMDLEGPTGAFLSSGLDSTVMLALMARHGGRIRSFSAGFEGSRASELPAAAAAAKRCGAEHHEIVLSPREFVAVLPRLVAARDAPLSRASDVALHLLAREAARSVRTVLTGEGCDEILGGYRRYAAERCAWLTSSLPTLLAAAAPLARSHASLRNAAASLRIADWRSRWARWTGVLDGPGRERLSVLGMDPATFPQRFDADPRASRLRRMLYFEQTGRLADQGLERLDRMTSAASLEARAPFLDHRFAERVSQLPDAMRVRGASTKWILRQAAARLAPAAAPRQGGFGVPAGAWLRGEMREFLADHLRGPGSLTRPYYDARLLDRILDAHLGGRRNHEELLWTLLNLEIWHRACLRP